MLRTIIYSIALASCARMPGQSVEISRALQKEGSRMHSMNITLIECIFNEKKYLLNEFLANEYAPTVMENFLKRLPPDVDLKREMPDIIAAINPKIDARRDSILTVLQFQKKLVLAQLNNDYLAYEKTFDGFQKLLLSAKEEIISESKFQPEHRKLIDLDAINHALDNFITNEGCVKEKATLLSDKIQLLLR